jgi:hypothetical protein
MKLQDIGFLLLVVFLLYKRQSGWLAMSGIVFLVFAMPLYGLWIFFTAERFVLYAVVLFLLSIIQQLYYARLK